MPKDKTETRQKILPAAKAEFLNKGFQEASMRNVAAAVGMSAAGLYRHFADKEAMFAALVEPVLQKCNMWYETHKARDYELLDSDNLEEMWASDADLTMMMELVYTNFDEFKLLLCCSEGTHYAHFLHELVLLEQRETEAFLQAAQKRGVSVNKVNAKELHLLLSAYVTALFEVVIHDFSKEDAVHYLGTLKRFFTPGWRAILGL